MLGMSVSSENVCPPWKRTESPDTRLARFTRLTVRQALVLAVPVAASLPLVLT